jgi:hypothetical protein
VIGWGGVARIGDVAGQLSNEMLPGNLFYYIIMQYSTKFCFKKNNANS